MNYPTLEQVKTATKVELGRWIRFLPSPGMNLSDNDDKFSENYEAQFTVMSTIFDRFYKELGGWEPWLSKQIGWDK